MKFKNLLIFIFLINSKILVNSEYYGNISITYEGELSIKKNLPNVTINIYEGICNISFESNFENFDDFFSNTLNSINNIITIDLSNLLINPKILKGMFSGCTGLTKIKGLSKLNTSEVISMSNMFQKCNALSEVDLSNLDTSLVTDMSYMFHGCNALRN